MPHDAALLAIIYRCTERMEMNSLPITTLLRTHEHKVKEYWLIKLQNSIFAGTNSAVYTKLLRVA